MVYVHQSMSNYTNDFLVRLKRKNYLTPTHYLDFINLYLYLIDEKSNTTTQQVILKYIMVMHS